MSCLFRCLMIPTTCLMTSASVSARTGHITPDGTSDAPSVQAGLDSRTTTRLDLDKVTTMEGITFSGIDLLLDNVYGLTELGRLGTYPDGVLGLSSYTKVCNTGNVNIPWRPPMNEDHPLIGFAFLRELDGRLEMIGKSWILHCFYAYEGDGCGLGCEPTGQDLGVGCSDANSASNNGSFFYLGPREEVNPHTADWEACGSFFDATPVDCLRDYFGSEPNEVNHRLQVYEDDLDLPGAQYYYEGAYYVRDDIDIQNNSGWRQVTMSWDGLGWSFYDGGFVTNPGPAIYAWGDYHDAGLLAPDDGQVILATKVTDLGGNSWHYQYALYNQTADRAIDSFSIPVGTANISSAEFRDIDREGANDWTHTVAAGLITWETAPFGSPSSNPLTYQSLYAFGFDADMAPQSASARLHIHKPGLGDMAYLDTQAPAAGATAALTGLGGVTRFMLLPARPNPFTGQTIIRYGLPAAVAVRLTVYDVTGRLVRSVVDGQAPAGDHSVVWDARDARGQRVSGGTYFVRLEAIGERRTRKVVFLGD